jgi:hypothetical protein
MRRALAAALALLLVAGCAEIVAGDPQGVSIDVGYAGEIAPGTRVWLSRLQAHDHCARFGRESQLVDLRGQVAVWRCVAEK